MTNQERAAALSETERNELNIGMFKAYDIRTKSHKLTPPIASRLLTAIGRYFSGILGVKRIVVGRDARLAAPSLLESAVDIFTAMGMDVLVNPLQGSTCLFYYSCMQNTAAAAVMFTASHNPGEYIGLKLLSPGMQTLAMGAGPQGGIEAILGLYLDNMPLAASNRRGRVLVRRYLDSYIDYSMKLAGVEADSLAGVPILADFLCGAAGTEVTEALSAAGARVQPRNLVPDGMFPAGDPNPVIISSIQPTWDLMKKGGFAFGFCFDGDGDRMDVMNEKGEQLAPSFNLTVLLPEITRFFKKAYDAGYFDGGNSSPWSPHMYSDVKANPLAMVDQAACGLGVHVIRNGHSFIKEALRTNCKKQYLVASEESAHYYMNFPYDLHDFSKGFAATENTLYFTLLTARLWAVNPQKYERAMERQKQIAREREWPCHFLNEALMEQVMIDVEAAFADRGLAVFKEMEDGSSLDATLMRKGLPEIITAQTDMAKPWYQVAQRISRSEEGMTRWEVVASADDLCREAVQIVRGVTDRYVAAGDARYE